MKNTPFHLPDPNFIDPEHYVLRDSVRGVAPSPKQVRRSEWLLAANVHFDKQQLNEAELNAFWELEGNGPSADVLYLLGRIAACRGQFHRAARRMEAAVKVAPGNGTIRAHYAEILRHQGLLKRAESEAREAVQIEPQNAATHNALGLVFLDLKRWSLALRAFHNSTLLAPDDAGYWNNLASSFRSVSDTRAASEAYRKAIELEPSNPNYRSNLASALVEECQHQEAIEQYQKALELVPGDAESWNHLGQVYDELGNSAEAESCFRHAIACNPSMAPAYVNILMHHEQSITPDDLGEIDRILSRTELTGKQRAALLYAKANVADRARDFNSAFELFREANATQRQWHQQKDEAYDPEAHERFVDRIIDAFSGDFLNARRAWGNDSRRPVFVIGLPRSGTTLTEQILAAHPHVYGAGELRLGSSSFERIPVATGQQKNIFECMSDLTPETTKQMAAEYLAELDRFDSSSVRVIDKMPENYIYAGWLSVLFPQARFVCCTRDLRDVAVSCLITSFRNVKWSNDDRHITHRFRQFQRIQRHWQEHLADRVLLCPYEQTVKNPEEVARTLIEWIGLPWDSACLDHLNSRATVRTASVSQARKPIYKSSVERWKNYLGFMPRLMDEIEQLGQ